MLDFILSHVVFGDKGGRCHHGVVLSNLVVLEERPLVVEEAYAAS
jgi:hypothetical protein